MVPKAIFFDLDETLLDDDRAFRIAVESTCIDLAHYDSVVDPHRLRETYFAVSERFWSELGMTRSWTSLNGNDGQATRRQLWAESLIAQTISVEQIIDEATSLYTHHRSRTYEAFGDVALVLAALHGRFPLAIITNGFGDTQREKLRVMEVDGYFDLVIASGEIGVAKPDPAIFQAALNKLGLAPEAVWHVGDSLASDVAGAKAAGLTSVWLNRSATECNPRGPQPDVEIASLSELLSLLSEAQP